MTNDLIVVKQLPIIEESLKNMSESLQQRVSEILEMPCDENTYKLCKDYRAELNKTLSELETRRKHVKSQILEPYMQFEEVYNHYIKDILMPAITEVSENISVVENEIKQRKEISAVEYYEEYAKSVGIDFVPYERMGLKITMNISNKKIKDTCKAFLDGVVNDLALIKTQENEEEILVEYKESLDAGLAIRTVKDRHLRIEQERIRREELEKVEAEEQNHINDIDSIIEEEAAPTVEEFSAPVQEEPEQPVQPTERLYSVAFKVVGTIDDIKGLKNYLNEKGLNYEQI